MAKKKLINRTWQPEFECMDRKSLARLQLERLQSVAAYCYQRVSHYRKQMDAAGVKPDDIRKLEDVRKLPFTSKADLRDNYPFGLFAVPKKEVVRVHSSSGTTGNPTVVGYTRKDLETWSDLCARFITSAGVTDEDTAQIAFGYGLFTGGFGLHYGMERVGARVIPASSGNTRRQIKIMQDFGTTALVCTPSYALYIGDTIREIGLTPEELDLNIGLFGAEPWSEQMRVKVEAGLDIHATDNYGLSEVIGPGFSGECYRKDGMHVQEDHFLAELVDPETLEPVDPDSDRPAELVITTLTKEAFPMLRYRTRDLTRLITEPCSCGRTTMRMAKLSGRTDDMLIIRGMNIFPSQVESVLLEADHVEPHYLIVVDRVNSMDRLEIQVEVSETLFHDEMRRLREHHLTLQRAIESTLGLSVELKLVEPRTLPRSEGKAKRVIDKRDI
ncbi:MAG: phenylacetate--CoA ligase [Candidatus Glassbacteria bacterium]|nr:phenylacetate--CoA ligase [Candidatus Glassbacteria bacterium]